MLDRPFGVLPDIEIDLPLPPSMNRIWRTDKTGNVYISKEYWRWKREADNLSMVLGQCKNVKRIDGEFAATIIIKRCHGDAHNRGKAVLDWAQSREIIKDDKYCVDCRICFGDAPHGCRLILKPREPN